MTRLLAALAILGLVLLVTWALWQRTNAAEARADLAEQQLAASLQREAQNKVVINALWDNARRQANQRRALAQQQASLARTASDRLATIEELHRENETLRAWATTRLPDAVSRMRQRPAVTGADAYHQSVRDAEPLHAPRQ
ncbi:MULTISPECIES: Rz-like lysis system protein LysB [unclassified Halomonas]|uniref:Rz-like lysis system protein LysB n=1 Tax=unclassified Halomonas TaxID=2609666 RepID=UPI0004AE9479|nr:MULTISPECIES: Rz-like lysis system protein LysB [unclassified Halomonas]PKH63463.1 peptidase [Halomonas sp. Choline-3u-9]QGQ69836.1 LysB family phage lysis regulatory protein [Halomonas sp. PA16-9]